MLGVGTDLVESTLHVDPVVGISDGGVERSQPVAVHPHLLRTVHNPLCQ